jgi:hypothetical protein
MPRRERTPGPDKSLIFGSRIRAREEAELPNAMNIREFMTSKARCAELESNTLPDFSAMTLVKLRKMVKERGIDVLGSKISPTQKEDFVDALERCSRIMHPNYAKTQFGRTLRELRARPALMSQSKFQHNSSRTSFLDLPGEVRNIIYELALFESPEGEYAEAGKWTLSTKDARDDRFPPVHSRAYEDRLALEELQQDRTLSVLKTLGAMNKQMRQEVQSFFFSKLHVTLDMDGDTIAIVEWYLQATTYFLQKIGPVGRHALAGLTVPPKRAYIDYKQHKVFLNILRLRGQCKNLQVLDLCLPLDTIIGPQDRAALEDFFLRGQALDCPSINDLVGTLRSIPRLRSVRFHMVPNDPAGKDVLRERDVGHRVKDDFLRFACTGARQERILREIHNRPQGLKGVTVELIGAKDLFMHYEAWKAWTPGSQG